MSVAFKNSFAALAFAGAALFSATSAQATLTVPAGGSAFQPFAAYVGKTNFNDSYSFTLGGLSNLNGSAFATLVSGFSVSLTSGSSTLFTDNSPGSFGYSNLGAGTYALNFSGHGNNKFFSGYGGHFSITPAVPEPGTLALALVGAGLLGGLALRKRKQRNG